MSVGTVKFIDLKNQRNNREQAIGLDNLVLKNVKSQTDLAGLAVLVGAARREFFRLAAGAAKTGGN